MENLHLIVGLGNPGRRYARTRHNAGFMAVERLAGRWRAKWTFAKKFSARLAWADTERARVLLCLPETFMNASGEAVEAVDRFYKPEAGRRLVVVDDADLPWGEVRMRPRGGTGGHHGLESVAQHWGTVEFARLRVGIGRSAVNLREITDYVLSEFGPDETEWLELVLDRACDQMECWLHHGIARAMNQFNGVITTNTKETE